MMIFFIYISHYLDRNALWTANLAAETYASIAQYIIYTISTQQQQQSTYILSYGLIQIKNEHKLGQNW